MKTLVWPDVHNRTVTLKKVLKNLGDGFDKRIFLGDYFDNFDDTPEVAHRTATYIKELLEDPKNVLLEGNHDTSYRYGNQASYCPGWTPEKHRAVRSVLDRTDFDQLKLFEYHDGFLCSHAGASEYVFQHPILGVTLDVIAKDCAKAAEAMRSNIEHPVYRDGISSGGRQAIGGITWLRWYDFRPIPGINQIVGHTFTATPSISYARKKVSKYQGVEKERIENVKVDWDHYRNYTPKQDSLCSINYNLDTNNAYFATIEDGEIKFHLTLDYL